DELDKSFTMLGEGTNRVVADPDGKSGHALNVKGPRSYPQLQITLPEGRKLGDYLNVTIDFKGGGCCGFYGAAMRLAISASPVGVPLGDYGSPASFGVPDGELGRGLIELPIVTLNLTPAQKEWTQFVLTVGSECGSRDYRIDNVTMNWEVTGETIIK